MSNQILMLYSSMVSLLDKYYSLNPIGDLGSVLSDLSTDVFNDGQPADPAVPGDWLRSVKNVLGDDFSRLNIERGLDVIIDFCDMFQREFGYDISSVIDELRRLRANRQGRYLTWEDWTHCYNQSG